jgi:hypothetical protein
MMRRLDNQQLAKSLILWLGLLAIVGTVSRLLL